MSSNTVSSQRDLSQAEGIVRRALSELAREWSRDDLAVAPLDRNLFEQIDSFAIVELLLRTESEVEAVTGRYIPLADEKVLDAAKSPLLSLEDWITYVDRMIANG